MTTTDPTTDAVGYALDHPAILASLKALNLEREGWKAFRDECYAWAKVRDLIDPGAMSNVGHKHIHWRGVNKAKTHVYACDVNHPIEGRIRFETHAPDTLAEARVSPLLGKAISRRDECISALVAEHGEWKSNTRGLYAELQMILATSPQGRERLSGCRNVGTLCASIGALIATADAYAYDQWSSSSCGTVHRTLRAHPDRVQLVSKGLTVTEAERAVGDYNNQERQAHGPGQVVGRRGYGLRVVKQSSPFRHVELPKPLRAELRAAFEAGCTFTQIKKEWEALRQAEPKAA